MSEACETPLPELLRAVPENHRLEIEINPTHHKMIPVGVHCPKAASELEALQKEVEDVRGDLAVVTTEFCEFRKHSWEQQETLRAQNREMREALQMFNATCTCEFATEDEVKAHTDKCCVTRLHKALSQPEAGKV